MNGFLLDTNIISELIKAKPHQSVIDWVNSILEESMYLSVLTLGEIRKGIEKLPQSNRRGSLERWLNEELRDRFDRRILAITESISDRWGTLTAMAEKEKQFLPVIDGLLVATAEEHNLTLVTRNVKDILTTRIRVLSPWDSD